MTVKQDATRAAVLGALRDLINDEYQAGRVDVLNGLVDARDELGVKSIDVTLPDGTKVASVTLTEPSGSVTVTDRGAFTTWVADKAPEQVPQPTDPVRQVVDAMKAAQAELFATYNGDGPSPSADEIDEIIAHHILARLGINPEPDPARVNPSHEKDLLSRLVPAGDGDAVDVVTGEVVPGVTATAPGQPSQFQMRYASGGRDAIAAAWRTGRLNQVAGLPQLETATKET